jgi:hypothetical protein
VNLNGSGIEKSILRVYVLNVLSAKSLIIQGSNKSDNANGTVIDKLIKELNMRNIKQY